MNPVSLVMNWLDGMFTVHSGSGKKGFKQEELYELSFRLNVYYRSLYTSGTFLAGIPHLVEMFNINCGRLNPVPIRYPSHGIIGEEFGNLRADAKFVPWRGLRHLVYESPL